MFNKELMLMGGTSSYTIYKITVEGGERDSDHYILGYNSLPSKKPYPLGALDPLYLHISGQTLEITFAYNSMYLPINRPYFYIGFTKSYPSSTAYIVRLDTKKGIYEEPPTGRNQIEFVFEPRGEPFFTEEDVGKTIELYISDAPPPFDWEKISM